MIKIGDVFEIPLSDGRNAYGQYIFKDKKLGPLTIIFDQITTIQEIIDINKLKNNKLLFPPIFTGIYAAVRTKLWRVIGRLPTDGFVYPNFVSAWWDDKTGTVQMWFLWDGENFIKLGAELPGEYKKLEYLFGWSPYAVVDRIETGKYPFPYGEMIAQNHFIPTKRE